MAEVKFTPGPWRLDAPINAHVISHEYHCIDAGQGFHSEDEGGFGLSGYMTPADACLIAASPALYEALKLALSALERVSDHMTVGDRFTNAGQEVIDALMPAREALTLAEGKKE